MKQKSFLFGLTFVLSLGLVGTSFAISGVGSVATQFTGQLSAVARLITAMSYVVGLAMAVAAIVKFKAHKDNPTQIPIGTPIALLFVSIALIFAPTIFGVGGQTLFGGSGTVAGPSGVAGFGARVAPGNQSTSSPSK